MYYVFLPGVAKIGRHLGGSASEHKRLSDQQTPFSGITAMAPSREVLKQSGCGPVEVYDGA